VSWLRLMMRGSSSSRCQAPGTRTSSSSSTAGASSSCCCCCCCRRLRKHTCRQGRGAWSEWSQGNAAAGQQLNISALMCEAYDALPLTQGITPALQLFLVLLLLCSIFLSLILCLLLRLRVIFTVTAAGTAAATLRGAPHNFCSSYLTVLFYSLLSITLPLCQARQAGIRGLLEHHWRCDSSALHCRSQGILCGSGATTSAFSCCSCCLYPCRSSSRPVALHARGIDPALPGLLVSRPCSKRARHHCTSCSL
jgi:hypothetical protein